MTGRVLEMRASAPERNPAGAPKTGIMPGFGGPRNGNRARPRWISHVFQSVATTPAGVGTPESAAAHGVEELPVALRLLDLVDEEFGCLELVHRIEQLP